MKKIGIIGAGFAGIYLGYKLKQRGHNVTIFEKDNKIGGLIRCAEFENIKFDAIYHNFFPEDKAFLKFIKEIGYQNEVIKSRFSKGIIFDKIYPFNNLSDALRIDCFSSIEKIKIFVVNNVIKYMPDFISEYIDTTSFLKMFLGQKLFKKSWALMLSSKFKSLEYPISLRYVSHRYRRTSTKSVYSLKKPLAEILENMIRKHGLEIRLNQKILRILKKREKYEIHTTNLRDEFDLIISAIPFPELAKIYQLPFSIKKLKYTSLAVMSIITRTPVIPFFFNTIMNPNFKSCVFINMNAVKPFPSNLFLNYLAIYSVDISNTAKLKSIFMKELEMLNPKLNRKDILFSEIYTTSYGQPVWPPNFYSQREKLFFIDKNFYATEYFLTYPADRSLNAVIQICNRVLQKI